MKNEKNDDDDEKMSKSLVRSRRIYHLSVREKFQSTRNANNNDALMIKITDISM
jgi:hypothetical protein